MSTSTETTPAAPTPKKPRTGARIALAAAILAIVAWLGHFAYESYFYEETDDAVVEAHVHQVSPQIDGTVQAVLVKENQTVAAGDVLVKLDPLEFELMVEKEQADAAKSQAEEERSESSAVQAQAQLDGAQARKFAAQAQVTQSQVQSDLAAINRRRARQLFHDGGAVTQSDLDNAESASNGAVAGLAAADRERQGRRGRHQGGHGLGRGIRGRGSLGQGHVTLVQGGRHGCPAKAGLRDPRGPGRRRIGNRNAETGNRVQAGQILFALVEPNPWIVANFKETQIARMHAGLAVDVSIDALAGAELHGTIDGISPASGAQFALLPPDNATGNFTKVVQRVPVKILLDPQSVEAGDRLRPGLSAVVKVRVR